MARLPRLNPPGVAQHIIQRGNNRQPCFTREKDYSSYLEWLDHYAREYGLAIHAYVLMTNHVHILATPRDEESASKTMQSLGRKYVRYFNWAHDRTGTLWEGRFRSCLVENERYLLECYRYIELNPVRAGLVADPADYRWSSHRINAVGENGFGVVPHPEYLGLGRTLTERRASYRGLFDVCLNDSMVKEIRDSVNKGLVLGSDGFKDQMEANLKRRVRPLPMGRPRKTPAGSPGEN